MGANWVSLWRRLSMRASASLSARTRLVILLTLSFVGTFILVVGLKLTKDHQTALISAERQATSVVGALSAQFRAVLFNVESLMDYAAVSHGAGTRKLATMTDAQSDQVLQQLNDLPWVRNLVVVGAKGSVLFDTTTNGRNSAEYSTDASFQYHAANSGDELFVSIDASFRLSKRINLADGSFSGVAIVELSRDSLSVIRRSADLNGTKTLILSGGSGRALAASPLIAGGRRPYLSSLFEMPWPPIFGEDGRALIYTTGSDGESYLVTAQQLRGIPFTLYLAEPVSVILSTWYDSLRFFGLVILAPGLFGAGICGILIRQIERRSVAEEARRASEARLNLAVTGARCGIWDWDIENDRMYWSSSMYAMLGRDQGSTELSLADAQALLHPGDGDALSDIAKHATRKSTDYDEIFRLRHAHGHWVWVHAKGQIWDGQTQARDLEPTRIMGIALDISDLKNAQSRIADAEARLRDAVDSLSESFVLWDDDNQLVLCNQKFAEFYDIDAGVLKPGAKFQDVMHAARAPGEVVFQSGTAGPGHATSHSSTSWSKEGSGELQRTGNRWIYVSRRTTRDGGKVSVGTDVTPLKDQELELLQSEETLKKYVEQLEKSQEKLQREADERAELALKYAAEKARAEEANRSKTEFLANMSHELRTPLNAIMGFAQIMQNAMFGPLGDERYVGYTKDILNSGQHLIDLISDILDMSKIESGKTELELNEYALEGIIGDCIRIVEPRVFEAGLHMENRVRATPNVMADKRATKQILLNLLTNAVKFTPRGGTLVIRAEVKEKYIALVVEDTGIGISEQDLKRIGKPFEQIESQQNKKYKGTGLGLALSKSLVELQGGKLRLKSQLGMGTTVAVTLPRADAVVKHLSETIHA